MKWSATMTTLLGSKTLVPPTFSFCRNATGPLTSFATTTSQRTMTTSPGRTSSASACASRIFSASVCGNELLQVLDDLGQGNHVSVLRVEVVEVGGVRVRVAVSDRLSRHDRPVSVLERVDGRRPHTPRCRRAGHDQAVASVRGEEARKRRAEERRPEQLVTE